MLLGFSLLPIRSQQPIFSGFLCRWTMHCPLLASQAPGARRWVRRVLELDAIGLLQLQVAGTTCRTWPSVLQLFGADKSWDDLVRWQSKQEGILRLESGNYWEVRWFTWTGFSIFTVTGFFQQIPGSGVRANHNIYIYILTVNKRRGCWLTKQPIGDPGIAPIGHRSHGTCARCAAKLRRPSSFKTVCHPSTASDTRRKPREGTTRRKKNQNLGNFMGFYGISWDLTRTWCGLHNRI